MNTQEYLKAAKRKLEAKTNAELARALGLSRPALTRYDQGEQRVIDDYTAARVAELLDIDELEVIAQANAEREKDTTKRAFWEHKAKAARQRTGGPLGIWRARDDSNVRPLPSEQTTHFGYICRLRRALGAALRQLPGWGRGEHRFLFA